MNVRNPDITGLAATSRPAQDTRSTRTYQEHDNSPCFNRRGKSRYGLSIDHLRRVTLFLSVGRALPIRVKYKGARPSKTRPDQPDRSCPRLCGNPEGCGAGATRTPPASATSSMSGLTGGEARTGCPCTRVERHQPSDCRNELIDLGINAW